MITCRELIDFLSEYTDGTLAAQDRSAFEEHLHDCPDCRHYVASYRQVIQLGPLALSTHPDDPPPPEVPAELVRAITAARHRPEPPAHP